MFSKFQAPEYSFISSNGFLNENDYSFEIRRKEVESLRSESKLIRSEEIQNISYKNSLLNLFYYKYTREIFKGE